ncbi:hypothetical protein [Flexilinea flocculi]|jgi:hypothetical protein|uniref:Uncharacterized protein n=1 Tax=Flexilinea flocculi TaxID=1678840 RepID=A0A0S7BR08_9CHLR|nr:hypothetical protein [Flexilinea flocculi]GAP40226.1 hypothetical protein ATC1_13193 [Flexilinea flocculi]
MKKIIFLLIFAAIFSMAFSIAPQAEPVVEEETAGAALEPIVFTGSGDDVLVGPIMAEDYPIIDFEVPCEDEYAYMKITLYGADNEVLDVFNRYCTYQGSFYYGGNEIEQIDYLEVSYPGDFTLTFLPLDAEVYTAPVAVKGEGTSVVFVENPGRILQMSYDEDDYFELYQYSEDVKGYSGYKQVYYQAGPYKGKSLIDNKFRIFQIYGSGAWEMNFIDAKK